ncbi:MAG: hypothetical protein U0R71_17535 [Solirubrobacterales bacterium]
MQNASGHLLDEVRADLPHEGSNRFVEALKRGQLPAESVAHFACEEYYVGEADRRSFAMLAARFPQAAVADFFLWLACSETQVREGVLKLGAAFDLDEADIHNYEPKAGCRAYPAYLSLLTLGGSQADVVLALAANMGAFNEACAAIAPAMIEHYGISPDAVQFLAPFGEPNPEFDTLLSVALDATFPSGIAMASERRAARLLQTYELQFWNTLADNDTTILM